MEKRLPLFMLLAIAVLVGSQMLMHWLNPPKPVPKPAVCPSDRSAIPAKARTGAITSEWA